MNVLSPLQRNQYTSNFNDVTVVQTNIHNGEIMHITGGKLRRRLVKIVDEKGVRPTASKVREAIFSMIGQDLNGVSFLDAFGGSGIMGLEAWSRGASPVLITEKNTRSVQQIRRQVQAFNISISVQRIDAAKGMTGDWDVIFLDPPYRLDIHPYLTQALEVSAWIVIAETAVESPPNLAIVQSVMDKRCWSVWKQKHYGASMVTIFQRNTSA